MKPSDPRWSGIKVTLIPVALHQLMACSSWKARHLSIAASSFSGRRWISSMMPRMPRSVSDMKSKGASTSAPIKVGGAKPSAAMRCTEPMARASAAA